MRSATPLTRVLLAFTLAVGVAVSAANASAETGVPEPAARPSGATEPGTNEWYVVPLTSGRMAMLGVYRPKEHGSVPSVLVLHGKDGPRRLYEDLASRYAGKGFIAIVACWFAYSVPEHEDTYGCPGIGDFHGAEATTVTDVNDIVDATKKVRGVEKNQLGIVGQSYGARMALLRAAATGNMEPVVSSCGYLASQPLTLEAETPVYPFPADADVAARIKAPVLVVHGDADPIIPVGQADVFVKAMSDAGHPISLITYSSPAGHSIPWDVVTALDDPQRLLRDRFLGDTVTWLRQRLLEAGSSKKSAKSKG